MLARRRIKALYGFVLPIRFRDRLQNVMPRIRTEQNIDFRNLFRQFRLKFLREATRRDQFLAATRLFIRSRFEQRFHRFILGRLDKSASVDDDDVRLFQMLRQLIAALFHETDHFFRIDQIFRAAEADKSKFLFHSVFSVSFSPDAGAPMPKRTLRIHRSTKVFCPLSV